MPRLGLVYRMILGVCALVFFADPVFAVNVSSQSMETFANEWMTLLQSVLKIIYILMRPMLVIAGNALDNTFVYGEFINLDAPLFQLWLITRTFVNYALGAYVLFVVLRYYFTDMTGSAGTIVSEIGKVVIVGIAIQFSRFLVGALIDISTILTYGLGGLPMTLIQQSAMGDKPIIGIQSVIDLGGINRTTEMKSSFMYYYSRGDNNYPACEVYKGFIIGARINDAAANKKIVFNDDRCLYNMHSMVNIAPIKKALASEPTRAARNHKAEASVESFLTGGSTPPIPGIVYTRFTNLVNNKPLPSQWSHFGQDNDGKIVKSWEVFVKDVCPNPNVNSGGCGLFLKDLLEKSRGFVGPLVTMYISLLNFADLHQASVGGGAGGTNYALFLQFFLKAVVGFLLFIPLIGFCVALVIRVLLLRIVIAFSPLFIFMKFGGGWGEGLKTGWSAIPSSDTWFPINKLDFGSIVGLIFSPVIVVATLGISLLFLQTLQIAFNENNNVRIYQSMNIALNPGQGPAEDCFSIWGLTDICVNVGEFSGGGDIFLNLFSWLIMNIFGIAIVYALLKTALSSSSLIGSAASEAMDSATRIASTFDFGTGWSFAKLQGFAEPLIGRNGDFSQSDLYNKYVTEPARRAAEAGRELAGDWMNTNEAETVIENLNRGMDADNAMANALKKANKNVRGYRESEDLSSILTQNFSGRGDMLSDDSIKRLATASGVDDLIKKLEDPKSSQDEKKDAAQKLKQFEQVIDSSMAAGLQKAQARGASQRELQILQAKNEKEKKKIVTQFVYGGDEAKVGVLLNTYGASSASIISVNNKDYTKADLDNITDYTEWTTILKQSKNNPPSSNNTKIFVDSYTAFVKKKFDALPGTGDDKKNFADFVNAHEFGKIQTIGTNKSSVLGSALGLDSKKLQDYTAMNTELKNKGLTVNTNGIVSVV